MIRTMILNLVSYVAGVHPTYTSWILNVYDGKYAFVPISRRIKTVHSITVSLLLNFGLSV